MQPNEPIIIIIEDDLDDEIFLRDVFIELGFQNQLKFFNNCKAALSFLKTTTDKLFLIICDVNLPGMSGTEFKKEINADPHLRKKAIPFIFYTTSANKLAIEQAYEMTVQGYFVKENSISEIKSTVKVIIDYWKRCKHPNSK
jgi:CheY-like chemotaxis protein